jgi:hypothetical protein
MRIINERSENLIFLNGSIVSPASIVDDSYTEKKKQEIKMLNEINQLQLKPTVLVV